MGACTNKAQAAAASVAPATNVAVASHREPLTKCASPPITSLAGAEDSGAYQALETCTELEPLKGSTPEPDDRDIIIEDTSGTVLCTSRSGVLVCRLWGICALVKASLFGLALYYALVLHMPPFPSEPTDAGQPLSLTQSFFTSDDIAHVMPRAPSWYPENLRSVLWMDSHGSYGPSELQLLSLEDAVMSFGDTKVDVLDEDRREIYVSVSGPGWSFFNNVEAYQSYAYLDWNNFLYRWNENYTMARIFPSWHWNGRNWFGLGPLLPNLPMLAFQHWMVKQDPPANGSCPPRSGASRQERAACAPWVRITCLLWCVMTPPRRFYVYEIVDAHGHKVEPYYSEFVSAARYRALPNPARAAAYRIDLGLRGLAANTMFHGKYL